MDFIGARVAVFSCSLPRRQGDTEKEAGPDIFCCSCRKMAFVSGDGHGLAGAATVLSAKARGIVRAALRGPHDDGIIFCSCVNLAVTCLHTILGARVELG